MAKTSRSAFVSETEVDARPVWLGAKAAAVAASVANTAVFMMIGTRLVGIVSTSVNHSRSGAGVLAASYKRRANLCCSSKWQGLRVGAGTLGSLSRRSRPRPLPAAAHVCSTKQAPTPSYRIRDRQAAEHVVTHIIETQIPEPTLQESRVESREELCHYDGRGACYC